MTFNASKFQNFFGRVNKSENTKLLTFIRNVGKMYTLECKICKKNCFLYEYRQDRTMKNGLDVKRCTQCLTYSSDPFSDMVHVMKKSTTRRNQKGRNHAPVFYDTAVKLKKIFDEQNGLCYYSGERMLTKSKIVHDSNLMSIERLNEELGYVENNCVFVCLKYQLVTRGVTEKIKKQIVLAMKNPVQMSRKYSRWTERNFEKSEVRRNIKHKKRKQLQQNGTDDLQQCNQCQQFKSAENFCKKRNTINTTCKICVKKYRDIFFNTPRGFVIKMVSSAKASSKRRARKRERNDDSGNLDNNLFDIVVGKFIEQQGCCARTNIELVFEMNSPFQPSIDRLNNSKGYTKDNIQLVISAVNNQAVSTP